jgi:hypothetical protein
MVESEKSALKKLEDGRLPITLAASWQIGIGNPNALRDGEAR